MPSDRSARSSRAKSPRRNSISSCCRERRTSPVRRPRCRSRADRDRVIRGRLSLAKVGLSRSPAARRSDRQGPRRRNGPFSERIAMNGFVKSGLTLALTLCGCGTAYAHAHLLQSAPAAGMVVTAAPRALRLDFSGGVQLGFTGVTLRGPGGAIVSAGHARLAPNDHKELLVPLPRALTRAKYTIECDALAGFDHTTRVPYGFRVAN